MTVPHGSTTMLRPWAGTPPPEPHWAGAMTNDPFSMARARNSTSQWSRPVASVKLAGTAMITAPAAASSRYNSGNRRSKQMLKPSRTSAPWAIPSITATTLESPGVTRADSRSEGPSSIVTSKRWRLRYTATTRPAGSISTDVLNGRRESVERSARLPRRIQQLRFPASSANRSVIGPGTGPADSRNPATGPR